MTKAQRLIDEYLELVAALGYDAPTLRIIDNGAISTFKGNRWMATTPVYWFERWVIRRLREEADATHDWWRPGQVDEVCRRCERIRRTDHRNGICRGKGAS
jgi:hypothetical protein